MNDNPIVGILAAATRDHLLIDVPLHITLCDKNPKGRVIVDYRDDMFVDRLWLWHQSTRQCSWCVKKLKKMQGKDS